ncbi:TetR/AcrR family transcriptional regulator [Nocardioides sp. CPCC 205120]|uniref:TetR/AcrR family transcriptional regulator n=1 Tax=Nocardioides sp. CPCC 205120 TaxID=3406462 RepID=UPI003B50F179
MTAPRGRPRSFDIDNALDAAVEVFWRHGYEGAGLTELTAAMGIGRPSLYTAFGDKAQLFRRALDRYVDRNMAYVEDALAQPTAHAVAEAFLTGNARAVSAPGNPPGCLSVQAMVTDQGDTFGLLRENRRLIEQRLADRFRRSITDGDLGADEEPDALASYLITVATGFAIRAADGVARDTLLTLASRALDGFPRPPAPTRSHRRPTEASRKAAP